MLPELDARLAHGELSLRGLNRRVLATELAQLANVNDEPSSSRWDRPSTVG